MLELGGTLETIRSVVPKHWLVPRAVWLWPLETWFNRAGASPQEILIQRADPDGWALCAFITSPRDSCTQPTSLPLYTYTHLLQVRNQPHREGHPCALGHTLSARLGGNQGILGGQLACIVLPPSSPLKAPTFLSRYNPHSSKNEEFAIRMGRV